jgi:hypothetical protein
MTAVHTSGSQWPWDEDVWGRVRGPAGLSVGPSAGGPPGGTAGGQLGAHLQQEALGSAEASQVKTLKVGAAVLDDHDEVHLIGRQLGGVIILTAPGHLGKLLPGFQERPVVLSTHHAHPLCLQECRAAARGTCTAAYTLAHVTTYAAYALSVHTCMQCTMPADKHPAALH